MKKNKLVFLFDADGVTITGNNVGYFLEKEFDVPRKETGKFFSGVFKDCLVEKANSK